MKNNVVAAVLWVIAIGLSIWAYPQLPDQVATHWGVNGEPNDYSSRLFAVAFAPVLMVFMFLMMRVMPKIDPKRKNYPRFQGSLDIVLLASLVLLLVVHAIMLFIGLGYDVPMSTIVPILVGGLFVVLGNVLPRFKHNYFVGIRTPWTLADESVWTRTHIVGGRIFFIGGLLLMVIGFIPSSVMVPMMLVVLIGIPVSTILVSYYYFRQLKGKV